MVVINVIIIMVTLVVVGAVIFPPNTLTYSCLDGHPPLALVGPEEGGLGPEDDRSVVSVDADSGHVRNKNLSECVLGLLDKEEHSA